MDTSIFRYGELPEFKKFTPENIRKQFPLVLKKIAEDMLKDKLLGLEIDQTKLLKWIFLMQKNTY